MYGSDLLAGAHGPYGVLERLTAADVSELGASVVGLGRLGAPLAAVLAARGVDVVGVDVDPAAVDALGAGAARGIEPDLDELLAAADGRLRATTDFRAAAATDVSFVIVPTPSQADGAFALDHVLEAVRLLGRGLRGHSGYHVVAVVSTVMPGSTGGDVRSTLERASGRTVGDDLGLCFTPSFAALGTVVRDMLAPPCVVIGESDARAGDTVAALCDRIHGGSAVTHRMSLVDAELTKLLVSTFVTTKISYANMIAELCERLPGADARAVTAAVGADPRVGPASFAPGGPYGGPCFPRDNRALAAVAAGLGSECELSAATDAVNRRQTTRLLARVRAELPPGGAVAILGLAYKPGTDVAEGSLGMELASALAGQGIHVLVADPSARPELPPGVALCTTADAVACADIVVIATPWPEFAGIEGRGVLIDPWGIA